MPQDRQRPVPVASEVRATFSYNPETGAFRRKRSHGRPCDRPAGFVHKDGYVYVKHGGGLELVHRLIWLMMTGEWPDLYVDHINGVRTDSRWANLRLVTPLQNSRNAGPAKDSKAGVRGVHYERGRWIAQATLDGRYTRIGSYSTKEEAARAYRDATTACYGAYVRAAA